MKNCSDSTGNQSIDIPSLAILKLFLRQFDYASVRKQETLTISRCRVCMWKRKYTCFGQFLCPSSGVISCTLSNGICDTGL